MSRQIALVWTFKPNKSRWMGLIFRSKTCEPLLPGVAETVTGTLIGLAPICPRPENCSCPDEFACGLVKAVNWIGTRPGTDPRRASSGFAEGTSRSSNCSSLGRKVVPGLVSFRTLGRGDFQNENKRFSITSPSTLSDKCLAPGDEPFVSERLSRAFFHSGTYQFVSKEDPPRRSGLGTVEIKVMHRTCQGRKVSSNCPV